MSGDEPRELWPYLRMPATLGAAPGPRNMPQHANELRFQGDVQLLALTATSRAAALLPLLPPGCELLGEPTIEILLFSQKNLGWLAGRGYNYLVVRIPVIYTHAGGRLEGNFVPVLWENLADPILTGREELGMPKLFASIADPQRLGDRYTASAEWEGFRFFELQLQPQIDAPLLPAARPTLLWYHMPAIGDWQRPAAQGMVRSVPGQAPPPTILRHYSGVGNFRFRAPRWEDMPTQYTYVRTLAEIPLLHFGPARYQEMQGIGDLSAYRMV